MTLMTIAEASAQLRVSRSTVRRLINAGQLRAVRLGLSGRSDRVHPDDLNSYINAHRRAQVLACPSTNAATPGKSPSVGTGRSIVDLLGTGRGIKRVK